MLISSDSNIWFDFLEISCLNHPFRLHHDYYLSDITFETEIDEKSKELLKSSGLLVTAVSEKKLIDAIKLRKKHYHIQLNDAIALSIAKNRKWILLSGDMALRKAAKVEGVVCRGSIWIYDQLIEEGQMSQLEYERALKKMLESVLVRKRRLPIKEIKARLERSIQK